MLSQKKYEILWLYILRMVIMSMVFRSITAKQICVESWPSKL
jgi:hypothetical protein